MKIVEIELEKVTKAIKVIKEVCKKAVSDNIGNTCCGGYSYHTNSCSIPYFEEIAKALDKIK